MMIVGRHGDDATVLRADMRLSNWGKRWLGGWLFGFCFCLLG